MFKSVVKGLFLFLFLTSVIGCALLESARINRIPEQNVVILGPERNLSKIWEELSKDFPKGPTKKIVNAFNINDGDRRVRRSFEQWVYEYKDKNISTVVSIVDGKVDNIITMHK